MEELSLVCPACIGLAIPTQRQELLLRLRPNLGFEEIRDPT
jgi:hypothetical protein